VFAKLKTLLRKAATPTIDAVSDAIAIAHILATYSEIECANYIKNARYA
jgi:hypothetical protein